MTQTPPIVIAIWCGEGKPSTLNEFLGPFVIELIQIVQNGVNINGHQISVRIHCFVCDTPLY